MIIQKAARYFQKYDSTQTRLCYQDRSRLRQYKLLINFPHSEAYCNSLQTFLVIKAKAVPLHAMEALGGK
jgi:hypothetical protein